MGYIHPYRYSPQPAGVFLCAMAVLVAWSVMMPSACADSPALPALTSGHQDSELFMKEITYALTGWDTADIVAEDLPNCVFREIDVTRPNDQRVFFLNNVDRSKLSFRWRQRLAADAWVAEVDIVLVGDQPVYEYRPGKGSLQSKIKTNRYKLTVGGSDYQHLVRAWKYIYAHGCVGT